MKSHLLAYVLTILITFSLCFTASAQEEKKDTTDSKKEQLKSIAEVTKTTIKYPGLFNVYQDSINGKVYLEIRKDQIGKEFIHFFHVENSPRDAGWLKGFYGWESILKVNQYFDRIEFVKQNPHYYFDPENALSKAANADINSPLISVNKIVAATEKRDTMLIEAENLFLSESLAQLKYLPSPESKVKNPFKIGNLSKEKTRFSAIRNYPMNSDVVVDYVYENQYPTNFGRPTITDARFTTIQVQHSMIQMPENDYQPRYEDPRVGYFNTQVTDQTSVSTTPYRDLIHRWHLVKKNPNAPLSEPVEPIVFWMENTTPEELRPWIKKGVEAWNVAFEKAGFKNAVVVKQQPDDAEWEAGDLRYNVLRWTAAPMMGSAWGPSFVNPRTGQILGADIMLDYAFIRGATFTDKLYLADSKGLEELMFDESENGFHQYQNRYYCQAMEYLKQDLSAARYLTRVLGYSEAERKKLEENVIVELMLHEVGHTLGLSHNFRASQLRAPDQLNGAGDELASQVSGSVMDYNPIHIALERENQGNFRNTTPGPYDYWAIEYGYKPSLDSDLITRSTEQQLLFGNDGDAMGAPGFAIDPTITRWDMSSDVVKYGEERIQLSRKTLAQLRAKLARDGGSYQDFMIGYYRCLYMQYGALNGIKHYIGGVKIDRAFVGQENGGQPFIPVSMQDQKRAMNALVEYGFSPRAFLDSNNLYPYLQRQRRGWDNYNIRTEDPKIHDQIAAYQKGLLAHLMHPTVLKRLTDSRLYGNTYTANAMLSDLTDGIFQEDLNSEVVTTRQNLQHIYLDGLISALSNSKYDQVAKSAVFYEIQEIDDMMKSNKGKNEETKAHREHLRFKIDKALKRF